MVTREQLTRYANSDLNMARKETAMSMYGTKKGVVEITYCQGTYKVTAVKGMEIVALFAGKKQDVADYIIDELYIVE